MNNLANVFTNLQKFQQFASAFRGNPEQMANQLLNSGRYTSEQIESAKRMATQMEAFFNGFKGM